MAAAVYYGSCCASVHFLSHLLHYCPSCYLQWESEGLGLTAVYCPGEPGFSVELRFSDRGRDMRMSWPPEVAAAVITAFDAEMGLRPLAARGT
jgi:hypothetical protein